MVSRKLFEGVENFDWSYQLLSRSRLNPYLTAVGNDFAGALQLYKLNLQVSALIFLWLAFLEVILRNALVVSLTARTPSNEVDPFIAIWQELTPEEKATYRKAENSTRSKGKSVDFERLISELPFSFWKHLLSSKHQTTLWASTLRHAFPLLKPQSRSIVFEAVESVVALRNRIAHHEPVFRRQLGADLAQIQQIIGWISPEALDWAKINLPSRVIS